MYVRPIFMLDRTTAAIVLEICYGIHVAEAGDEYVSLADQALAGISLSGNFGTFIVDYLPILKYIPAWVPGAKFKREGLKWRRISSRLFNYAFDSVKQKLVGDGLSFLSPRSYLSQGGWLCGTVSYDNGAGIVIP